MPDTAADESKRSLEKEANDRLKECERQKSMVELDLREGYYFASPWRSRQLQSRTSVYSDKPDDTEEEPATSLGMEVSSDFATLIINTFMPPNFDWARRGRGMYVTEDQWEEVKDEVAASDKAVMNAIRASNVEMNAFQMFNPDIGLGTAAVWIDDRHPASPAVAQPVPIRELEINVGPHGDIDDRFAVKHVKRRNLRGGVARH